MINVSVIIPAYNSGKYIKKCLDSVLNQNFDDYEIIVIDDGSTDNTPEIVENYVKKHSKIRMIRQKNLKQSAARNNGIKHANGKYIMFIDSDDYIEKDMIREMYECIEKENSDLCICGINKIFNKRTEVEIKSCLRESSDFIADYLCRHKEMDVGVWNKIFKKDVIQKNNIWFENGNFFEDTLFVFKYLCHTKKISFIEKPMYNLLKRENSTTTRYNPEIMLFANKLEQKIEEYLLLMGKSNYIKYISCMKVRNRIHIIHHNIKYNKENSYDEIKRLLKSINKMDIKRLTIKYKLAIIMLNILPNFYKKIYLKFKG